MYKQRLFIVVMTIMLLVLLASVAPVSSAPQEGNVVHVVQRGDTLYSIARRYGVNVWTIARANGLVNPNHIYVGQRLVIPNGQPASVVHVVQPGEMLTRIALHYGVDVWSIARANGISNLNHIYVGQRLTIPGAATPAPPAAATSAPQPAQPSTYPGPWSGEYFDNITLAEPAYVTRDDEEINFNWSWGPPAGGMPTNSFAVRWTGKFRFEAGDYRFYAKADDGVRVYVDGERIIDGWRDGGLRLYTADQFLTEGDHEIKVEYYDRIQVARVYFWWKKVSDVTPTPGPTGTPEPTLTPTLSPTSTPSPGIGWFGQYYNNMELQEPPFATQYVPWIGAEWNADAPMPGMRSDYFSIRWTTTAYLEANVYLFCAMSDDGARIWVDDHRVLDEWHPNNGVAYCGEHEVETGDHEVKVEYYEEGGNALIYVWWYEKE